MAYLFNGGVTAVSNYFIDKLMPSAPSAYVVVYLCALRAAQSGEQLTDADIAARLGMLESDVIKAWDYWQKNGAAAKKGNDIILDSFTPVSAEQTAPHSPVKPTCTPAEAQKILTADASLKGLVKSVEKSYGKPFSSTDIATVIGFSKWLGLPDEVIMVLFDYCGDKPMRYIEKVACDWADKGINTFEAAEEHINTHLSSYREIMSAFGASGRAPVEKEIKYMDNWLHSLKMPMDMIREACQRAVINTGKPSFDYANSIINNWAKNNVRDLVSLEELDKAFKQRKTAEKPADKPKVKVKTTGFVNYDQPVYSDEQFAEIMKRKQTEGA